MFNGNMMQSPASYSHERKKVAGTFESSEILETRAEA